MFYKKKIACEIANINKNVALLTLKRPKNWNFRSLYNRRNLFPDKSRIIQAANKRRRNDLIERDPPAPA